MYTWGIGDKIRAQEELIKLGYDVGPEGADGRIGAGTEKAIAAFQSDHGLSVTGKMDDATAELLFPLKRRPDVSKWFTTFVGTTAFKYLVAMLATYIAAKLGLDPVEGKATIEGVISQLVGVAMGIWGMWESTKSKVVVDGHKVKLDALPTPAQNTVVKAVETAKDLPAGTLKG